MRVVFSLLRSFNDGVDGDFRTVDALAGKLREYGTEVFFLSPSSGLNCGSACQKEYLTEKRLCGDRELFGLFGKYIEQTRRISREVDIVHCHLDAPALSLLADRISMKNNTPVVVTFAGPYADNPFALIWNLSRAPLYYGAHLLANNRLTASLSRFNARYYTVSSEFQKTQLLNIGMDSRKLAVIPNGIIADKAGSFDREESRREFGLGGGKIVVYIGHFRPNKGVDFLVKAFKKVLAAHPDAKLVLAWSLFGSDGSIRRLIKKLRIEDRVILLGRVNVSKLLSAADVVALPYVFEFGTHVFPLLVLECFSAGVPLVTSDLKIINELTDNGKAALLAKPADLDDLARAVIKLISDQGLASRMIREQRRLMERYKLNKIAEQYIEIYQRLLNG